MSKPCDTTPKTNATSPGLERIQETRTSLALPPIQPKPEQPAEVSELAQRMDDQIALQEHIDALEQEYSTRPGAGTLGSHDDELATWYLGKQQQLDDCIDTVKAQAEAMIRSLEARKRGLAWRWGGEFKQIIDAKLHSQGGKKKSVTLLTGRAGYRTSPAKTIMVDQAAALEWCEFNKPDAIRREVRLTPLKDHIKETGEVPPGVVHQDAKENFYPPINIHQLPPSHHHHELEGA